MNVLLLVNPHAGGRGNRRVLEIASARFRDAGWLITTVITETQEHAADLIRSAPSEGFDLLVIAGGDGSIHNLVQHLPISTRDRPEGIPFGIIPLGSGNDFYRGIGAPLDPLGAADNIVDGTPTPVDIGLIEAVNEDGSPRGEKPIRFTNTVGVGIDSQTLATRERLPAWFSARYELLFLLTLLWMRPMTMWLKAEEWERELQGYWILCSNTGYIGTGMHIAPEARLDDGLIDVVIIEKIPKMRFVMNLPKVFKGTHVNVKGFSMVQAKSLILRTRPDFRLAIDGDREFKPPARISILPGAVRLRTKVLPGAGPSGPHA